MRVCACFVSGLFCILISDFYPMKLRGASWDISTHGSEDCLESSGLLSMRPFRCCDDEASDEIVEPMHQDNPFYEGPEGRDKRRQIVFKSKGADADPQNWSERIRKLTSRPVLVRSVPERRSSHWDNYDNGELHTLPSIGHGRSDSIKRITAETAAALLSAQIKRDFVFVDARFKYEYLGGHLNGAINVTSEDGLLGLLQEPRIVIFYCEFSSVRGPALAQQLRSMDRRLNTYPRLNCPEIYVMEGGYSNFYSTHPVLCTPVSYVTMHDSRFKKECAEEYRKKKLRKH